MGYLDIKRLSLDCIGLVVFGFLICNIGQVTSEPCLLDTKKLTFDPAGTSHNISVEQQDWGGLDPLFRMVGRFLDAVQPNPFPKDLLRAFLTNSSSVKTSEVVNYEGGYVACAVITVVFLILMLGFGITFCVFQFRGKRIFRRCDTMCCRPTPVFIGLILICSILFAGLVCTFYLNQKVQEELHPGIQEINGSLEYLRSSITNVLQALEKLVSAFSIPKQKVLDDLQSFGPAITVTVQTKLYGDIYPRLRNAIQTAKQLEEAGHIVVDVNKTVIDLKQRQVKLEVEINTRKENLQKVLSDSRCVNCKEAADTIPSVQLGLDYSKVPPVDSFVNNLENLRKVNLTGLFQQGMQALDDIPKLVNTETSKSINEIKVALDTTEKEIRSLLSKNPIQKYINPINQALLDVQVKYTTYGKEVERYEYYRWIVGVVLCCVLLLIVFCTILGLLLGVWGLYSHQDPRNATVRQRAGSGLLLGEVYLSFFFSWPLILLVFVTFLVGGNVETLLCRHWANGDVYRFLDDPQNLPQNINLKKLLGLRDSSNFSTMYQQCKSGAPVWTVLDITNPTDTVNSINISKYTAEFQSKIDNFTVDVKGLDLFSSIAILVLSDYKNSGLDKVPYSAILTLIQAPLLRVDIGQFVSLLEGLAAIQSDPAIRGQLVNEAAALRQMNSTLKEQEADMKKLNSSVYSLSVLAPTLEVGISRTIGDIQALQGSLIPDLIQLLKNDSTCLLRRATGYFSQYVEWVKLMITEEISSCRSVSVTLDNFQVVTCNHVTIPWNGFWFCLGWCTLFLIPNVLFSIKSEEYITPLVHRSRKTYPEEENIFPLTASENINPYAPKETQVFSEQEQETEYSDSSF